GRSSPVGRIADRALAGEAMRFILAGAVNTALTYAAYLALLYVVDYAVAYTIAYVAGIAFSYYLNTRFVFRTRAEPLRAAAYPLVYLVPYLFGLAVLHVAVAYLSIPRQFALLASIALSVPLTFVLSRLLLVPGAPRERSDD